MSGPVIAPQGTVTNEYWALEEDPRDLASAMRTRIEAFWSNCDAIGRRAMWAQMLRLYFGLDPDGGFRSSHYVNLEGTQGENVTYRMNDIRALVRKQLTMTTGTRPMFELTARAYDASTTEAIEIGNAVLDRYLDDVVEAKAQLAAEYMLVIGEGWLATTWDDMAGRITEIPEVVDPMTGQLLQEASVQMSGDVRVLALRPDQVIRDTDITQGPEASRWVMLIVQRDKWEMAAKYPEYRDEILRATNENDRWIWQGAGGTSYNGTTNYDVITTYELYHRRSPVVPRGLQAIMVGDCVVSRGDMPYDDLPVAWSVSGIAPGDAFGYGESWDLAAPQIAIDSVTSQLATNRENYGRAWIAVHPTADFDSVNLSGAKIIKSLTPPQVLDLSNGGVASGQQMIDLLRAGMGQLTGLDAQSEPASSGEMLALQQQQSAQYNSRLQFAWFAMYKRMLGQMLKIVQRFVSEEDTVHISGENNAPVVKRWKGADLHQLDGIKVDMGTTAMRTASFRYQVAQNLLTAQVISPQQYLQMISTGRYQPALEAPKVLETMAERRMQIITDGGVYKPMATDPHELLIARLSTLMCDPEMEQRAVEIMPIIMAHVDLWTNMSLNPQGISLLAATGQGPSPGAALVQQMQAAQAAQMAQQGQMPPDAGQGPQNMQNAPAAPAEGAQPGGSQPASLPAAAQAPAI
jgi:hypothetical protein